MQDTTPSPSRAGAHPFLTAALLGYALAEGWLRREVLLGSAGPLLALALPAAATAWLSATHGRRAPRLGGAFVLAALWLLPAPGPLWVVLAAALVGGGGQAPLGAVGRWRELNAAVLAVAMLEWAAELPTVAAATLTGTTALAWLALAWLLLAGLAIGWARLFGSERAASPPPSRLAVESLALPLAWILGTLLRAGDSLSFGLLVALLVSGQFALIALFRASEELQASRGDLEQRRDELATLHALGREILASLDPERLYALLDRECRKLFDADRCTIDLVPPGGGAPRRVFPIAADASEDGAAIAGAEALAEIRRPLRVDDLTVEPASSPLRSGRGAARSLLAAPLVVEDRVVGILAVHGRAPARWDDDRLDVLTTIAQQAAGALENARHYRMATVDSLTGCFVRDYLFRRLEEEHRRARRYGGVFTVLMIDLDAFKTINDTHGHLVGDRFLRAVSACMRKQLRGADLACRYGGDEFCVVLPETDVAGAQVIAERIRTAVAERFVDVDGVPLRSTVSIGLSTCPVHEADDVRVLLRKADEALYRAKRRGRDRVVSWAA